MRVNPDGIVWSTTFGQAPTTNQVATEEGVALWVTAQAEIIVAGRMSGTSLNPNGQVPPEFAPVLVHSTDDSEPAELGGFGWSDMLVTRYDSDGVLLWARAFGGKGDDQATDVVATDSAVFVTGRVGEGAIFDDTNGNLAEVPAPPGEEGSTPGCPPPEGG